VKRDAISSPETEGRGKESWREEKKGKSQRSE